MTNPTQAKPLPILQFKELKVEQWQCLCRHRNSNAVSTCPRCKTPRAKAEAQPVKPRVCMLDTAVRVRTFNSPLPM